MNERSNEEIHKFIDGLYNGRRDFYSNRTIDVRRREIPAAVIVKIASMYDYVPLNLKILMDMAEFFGTKNINDSRYASDGCETCDYGSSYEITMTIAPEKAEE